ncbi:MAG: DNA primase [Lachnospiraceae bacterium]|nr:DNA primase [Lachnospiraceae bacterium]
MYYSEELVEEIRSQCDIVDLISGYVSLKKKGSNYFGLCPFHNEKSGSFSVSRERQMFHCFGCGVSGNAYTFLMKYENFTFPESVQFLAQRAGISLPEESADGRMEEKEKRRKELLAVNKDAATYFYYALRDPSGSQGLAYFQGRQLSEETMHRFGLGYADKSGKKVIAYLRSKGHSDEAIRDAGLAEFHEKYGLSGKFWNRVMFPIQDIGNRVIGFGGRVMGEGEPKYLNSPETEIFNKRRNLYGMNYARTSRKDHVILCEGYMDVIAMHQAGFNQAVASLGTAFTDQQAMLIGRYVRNVILSYDSDEAGTKAALRAIGILRQAGLSGKVLNLKPYKDPDEFIKNLGKEEFEKRLKEAENGFYFEIAQLAAGYDQTDPDQKTQFHNALARKLCSFSQEIERENYLQAIAEKYFINPQILREAVISYAAAGMEKVEVKPRVLPAAQRQKEVREKKLTRSCQLLLGWLCDRPRLYRQLADHLKPSDFKEEPFVKAAELIFEKLDKEEELNPAALISCFEEEEDQRLVAEIFHARDDVLQWDGQEQTEDKQIGKIDQKVFREVLLSVKNAAYEEMAKTAPLAEVMACKKDIEKLSSLKIEM